MKEAYGKTTLSYYVCSKSLTERQGKKNLREEVKKQTSCVLRSSENPEKVDIQNQIKEVKRHSNTKMAGSAEGNGLLFEK